MSAEVLTNLESIGDMIGGLMGIADGLDESTYMETIIKQAHNKASDAFNITAASVGTAGMLSHVFEFGTAGITRGQQRFADPTSPAARLWIHTIEGHGGTQDIGYSFRPARVPNPRLTSAETGISSKYLSKLSKRKYIFWNKALVMETGATVEIRAKNSDFLFIPTGKSALNPKGFVMYNTTRLGPVIGEPGRSAKGTFTGLWLNWWNAAGAEIMEMDMEDSVTADTIAAQRELDRRAAAETMKPVQSTNIIAAKNSARSWMHKIFGGGRKVKSRI